MQDPNTIGLEDVTAASYLGSIVSATIDVIDSRHPLSGSVKSWLAPLLCLLVILVAYGIWAWQTNSVWPFAKSISLAYQAYGQSQGQHVVAERKEASAARQAEEAQQEPTK